MMDGDTTSDLEGGVYKGPHGDTQWAYIVSAPFELVEADKVGKGKEELWELQIVTAVCYRLHGNLNWMVLQPRLCSAPHLD
jgi:hypothetical protein